MKDLLVAGSSLIFLLAYLLVEKIVVASMRRSIPLRICVTGTRGKSSVVRLIAAGLREGGKRVVAKTTGSKAAVITPGGEDLPLRRRGRPCILEQRKLLRMARRWRAQVLVAEAMSIRPENHSAELNQILRPHVLVITNVRLDHLADMGSSLEEVSAAFAQGSPRRGRVFALAGECPPSLFRNVAERGTELASASTGLLDEEVKEFPYLEWKQNVQLALSVCDSLGIPRATALRGMYHVRPDFGCLKAWLLKTGAKEQPWIAINAFAANDPDSTLAVLTKASEQWNLRQSRVIGLLSLRSDRGDRTEQWCRALAGDFPAFDRLLLTGGHSPAARRYLKRKYKGSVLVVRERQPRRIMERITTIEPYGGVLFGFGNIGGVGRVLVEYWDQVGQPL